jgi:hypothetical protein
MSMAIGEDIHFHGALSKAHAGEGAGRVVNEVPVADAINGAVELKGERTLCVTTGNERERLVQAITKASVDVPASLGTLGAGKIVDDQHEVVCKFIEVRTRRIVDSTHMTSHPIAQAVENSR